MVTCQIPDAGVRVPGAAGAGAPHPHDGNYASTLSIGGANKHKIRRYIPRFSRLQITNRETHGQRHVRPKASGGLRQRAAAAAEPAAVRKLVGPMCKLSRFVELFISVKSQSTHFA